MKLGLISRTISIFCLFMSFSESSFATARCPLHLPPPTFLADYTSAVDRQKWLTLVESAHFTPSVQNLTRGKSGSLPGPDITYTLDRFPNHHLALDSLSRYTIREKNTRPYGVRCTIEDYFERAIEFKPEDGMVRMLYGMHFSRLKKNDKAIEQFQKAEKLDPENTNLLYNLGLLYFDFKQYDKAAAYAQKAYQDDFPLDGLKNKLKQVGKWVEPEKKIKPEEKDAEKTTNTEQPAQQDKSVVPDKPTSPEQPPKE